MPQVYQPLDVKNDLGEKEDDYEEGVWRVSNIQLVRFYEEVVYAWPKMLRMKVAMAIRKAMLKLDKRNIAGLETWSGR